MFLSFSGSLPRGASVTSGVVSTFAQINAGDITINGVVLPVVPAVADAPTRTAQLVALINTYTSITGVAAVLVTTTTYALYSGVALVIALGATGTLAGTGLTAATTPLVPVLLATRKAFGSSAAGSDDEVVEPNDISVRNAKKQGRLDRVGTTDIELSPPAAHTTTGG